MVWAGSWLMIAATSATRRSGTVGSAGMTAVRGGGALSAQDMFAGRMSVATCLGHSGSVKMLTPPLRPY